MLYISKIGEYLNILTDDEVKDFVVIKFEEYLKSSREKKCILSLVRTKMSEKLLKSFISF